MPLFPVFVLIPVDERLFRAVRAVVSEHVRVAGNQLAADLVQHLAVGKFPRLLAQHGVKHRLQEDVPRLFPHLVRAL